MECKLNLIKFFVCLVLSIQFVGCSSISIQELVMMPTPELFNEELKSLLNSSDLDNEVMPYDGILYMTDRLPVESSDSKGFYQNARSGRIRVGIGQVSYSGNKFFSKEFRSASLLKKRSKKEYLQVSSVNELGVLFDVKPFGSLHDPHELDDEKRADESFVDLINKKLAISDQKDIYLYVHGYKVVFEKPLLVSSELWNFMGYSGVFIPYSWPATPRRLAYFKDIETASLSGHNLRLAIEFLAKNTNAEQIHIIGFSAGTRVVMTALHELALTRSGQTKQSIQKELRVGQVALIGSDYDRQRFGAALSDGLLKVPKVMTVYISETDDALGMSKFFFREKRLGQYFAKDMIRNGHVYDWFANSKEIYIVNVTSAEKSNTGNGHAYFRNSPWASSDLLMTIKLGLTPKERGLVLKEGEFIWGFPEDYIAQVRNVIQKILTSP